MLLEGFGLHAAEKDLVLRIGQDSMRRAEQRLLDLGIKNKDLLFGLSPGSALSSLKRWHPERFAEVATKITTAHNARGLLFGASGERALGEHIQHEVSDRCIINLAGETVLEEAIALIGHCGLFISNDSGLMHIAAGLDVPLVAVFGPSDPRTTSPWCTRHVIVRKTDISCSPCMKKEHCPYDHQCMTQISADDVLHAVQGLMDVHGFDTIEQRRRSLRVSETSVPVA
jgi:heptosyltransferase-2